MKITVEYATQLRDAARVARETIEIANERPCLRDLLVALAESHGEPLSALILNDEGSMSAWIFADQGGVMLRSDAAELHDGDVIRLLSPISGG